MAGTYHLFQVCGIEIEYMVVDKTDGNVRSLVEPVLAQLEDNNARLAPGSTPGSVPGAALTGSPGLPAFKRVEWSNEFAAHVAEAKSPVPVGSPAVMLAPLRAGVAEVNEILAPLNARLMPSAAHPWMDPARDATLWPHDPENIYATYDRIFGCRTHGWLNLQSVHINLPFAGDEEFGRLHAAVRVVLPLIPALAAASPYLDGRFTGFMDARMDAYQTNSSRVPSMTGRVIPEPVFTERAYRSEILERIYAETAPFDPEGVLRDEWANARGAIARFDRNAIEIRVMDSQECPLADLGLAHAVITVARLLAEEHFAPLDALQAWDTERLRHLLFAAVRDAEAAVVHDRDYAALFDLSAGCRFRDIWVRLLNLPDMHKHGGSVFAPVYEAWLRHGPLARRLTGACGKTPDRVWLKDMADALCECLASDQPCVY
jgi:gamma-glutamyl:cysteine ligase YbdK (ATP-grasp superfamily)